MSRLVFDRRLALVLLLVLFAVGCSSGTDNGTDSGTDVDIDGTDGETNEPSIGSASGVRTIGRVGASRTFGETEDGTDLTQTVIIAKFRQYDRELSNDELEELSGNFDTLNGTACEIEEFDVFESVFDTDSTIPESHTISAGEVLPITTPAGSWPDLGPSQSSSVHQYRTDTNVSLPSGALVHIPGEEFPAVESAAIPNVEEIKDLNITHLENGRVMPESVVSWQPSDDANSVMLFSFGIILRPQSLNFDGHSLSVRCVSEDNGTFNFPAEIHEVLSEGILRPIEIGIVRRAPRTTRQIGDAVLWVDSFTQYPGILLRELAEQDSNQTP